MQHGFYIDSKKPSHAAAYLKAASHILSGWPQDWDAEHLALALVDDENPDQEKVSLWNPIKLMAADEDTDPYLKSDQMICDLAEDFIEFLTENALNK